MKGLPHPGTGTRSRAPGKGALSFRRNRQERKIGMRIAYIEPWEELRVIESDASLESLQSLVGGLIEPFDVLFGQTPSLYVNEEGLFSGMLPNRPVYANQRMVEMGYVSQADPSRTVARGELYQILHGPIVAVSYDEDPDTGDLVARDITEAEVDALRRELGGPGTGQLALEWLSMALRRGGWVQRADFGTAAA